MPIDPVKIPQNVYIEDHIVGPLTLKQIIIVAIGCGFSYALYSLLLKSYGQISLPVTGMVWLPGLLSFMFAFIKINDLSMFRLVLLMMEHMNKPSVRTWSPRRGVTINIRTFTAPDQQKKKPSAAPVKETNHLDELSAILDGQVQQKTDDDTALIRQKTLDEEESTVNRPVDRSRISASPIDTPHVMDTVAAPTQGTVSIFRDLAPHA